MLNDQFTDSTEIRAKKKTPSERILYYDIGNVILFRKPEDEIENF